MKARVVLEELEGIPLLTFTNTPGAPFPMFVKRLAGHHRHRRSGWSLTGAAAAAHRRSPSSSSSRGPVLYSQQRCGLNGRRFTLLKFRTMYEGADQRLDEVAHLNEVDGPAFKARRDPRVTPVGRVLRRLSLDELPQLVQRPPGRHVAGRSAAADARRGGAVRALAAAAAVDETRDHRSLAGLGPRRSRRLQPTGSPSICAYIDQWSLWLDLKILLKTIPAVLSTRGAS